MSQRTDYPLPPLMPRLAGYDVVVEGQACTASWRRTAVGGRWTVRAADGRLLGAGPTVAGALRAARLTVEGDAR